VGTAKVKETTTPLHNIYETHRIGYDKYDIKYFNILLAKPEMLQIVFLFHNIDIIISSNF
jgi:hypothetical protein